MSGSSPWVTACIPTFRCTKYLRTAVMSLLTQTYPFVRVIVINDGDPNPPWPSLNDITDPRLIRFDLRENRGPYFCLAVAVEATADSLFLTQDADDWSSPDRVAILLQIMRRDCSNFAFSTIAQFQEMPSGDLIPVRPLFATAPDTLMTEELKYRIPHHGLFQTKTIKGLGGYFAGFRFGYDTLLMNLLLLTGSVSWTPEPLYWRRLRTTSLSNAPDTGLKSIKRELVRAEREAIYRLVYEDYSHFARHRISRKRLFDLIRSRVKSRCTPADLWQIAAHAAQLRRGIHIQSGMRK
jgi:glycosyltransferase involved in cell wall biosynthesis